MVLSLSYLPDPHRIAQGNSPRWSTRSHKPYSTFLQDLAEWIPLAPSVMLRLPFTRHTHMDTQAHTHASITPTPTFTPIHITPNHAHSHMETHIYSTHTHRMTHVNTYTHNAYTHTHSQMDTHVTSHKSPQMYFDLFTVVVSKLSNDIQHMEI